MMSTSARADLHVTGYIRECPEQFEQMAADKVAMTSCPFRTDAAGGAMLVVLDGLTISLFLKVTLFCSLFDIIIHLKSS